jgi:hypothetical protein
MLKPGDDPLVMAFLQAPSHIGRTYAAFISTNNYCLKTRTRAHQVADCRYQTDHELSVHDPGFLVPLNQASKLPPVFLKK